MNPDEGELRPQLQDRFSLCAAVQGIKDEEGRGRVVIRRLAFEKSPEAFAEKWEAKERTLADHILEAKRDLARVTLSEKQVSFITRLAGVAGADGHRADIAMAKSAMAMAAYAGRDKVTHQEVIGAARLVLPHRLRQDPAEELPPLEKIEQIFERVQEADGAAPEEVEKKVSVKKNLVVEAR
jgi:Mg-chelatase subunit ChlI